MICYVLNERTFIIEKFILSSLELQDHFVGWLSKRVQKISNEICMEGSIRSYWNDFLLTNTIFIHDLNPYDTVQHTSPVIISIYH